MAILQTSIRTFLALDDQNPLKMAFPQGAALLAEPLNVWHLGGMVCFDTHSFFKYTHIY